MRGAPIGARVGRDAPTLPIYVVHEDVIERRVVVVFFLPRDAILARYMLSPCVCLSVRLSVTRRYCIETAKQKIKI